MVVLAWIFIFYYRGAILFYAVRLFVFNGGGRVTRHWDLRDPHTSPLPPSSKNARELILPSKCREQNGMF